MINSTLREFLTYDDVLILPNFSSTSPYDGNVWTKISKNIFIDIPIVSSPMDTVTELDMAVGMAQLGGVGVIHRNMPMKTQVEMVSQVKAKNLQVGAAIGPFDHERALALENAGCSFILIDVSHGMKLDIIESARQLKSKLKCDLICGSIGTKEGAEAYSEFADGLRVGVGPGSICTMRVITGVGVPQLSAIMEVVSIAKAKSIPVIADGGIRTSGDIAKAIAAGANCVMLGNLLAGLEESPGETVQLNGQTFKKYRGMGSTDVLNADVSSDRYEQKELAEKISMGVSGMVPYRGKLNEHIHQLLGGLKASMGLVGAENLEQMHTKAQFVKISAASNRENHPHSLTNYKKEKNYE